MKFLAVFVALFVVAASSPIQVSSWTLAELSSAIQNPNTNPAYLPYLEQALNEMMDALVAGHPMESIAVHFPVIVEEEKPVALPVAEAPVAATPTAASPLVQIIVNIQQRGEEVPAVAVPSPVIPEVIPEPVSVVDQAPEPVHVVEQAPEPVHVVEQAPEIVNVVDQLPITNPIDVIAVGAPEVNPVDILHPVVQPAVIDNDVGPIV